MVPVNNRLGPMIELISHNKHLGYDKQVIPCSAILDSFTCIVA